MRYVSLVSMYTRTPWSMGTKMPSPLRTLAKLLDSEGTPYETLLYWDDWGRPQYAGLLFTPTQPFGGFFLLWLTHVFVKQRKWTNGVDG